MRMKQQKSPARLAPMQGFKSNSMLPIHLNTHDAILEFNNTVLTAFGLCEFSLMADGEIHRFHVPGDKRGTVNGWYFLNINGWPHGMYGSWKGLTCSWRYRGEQKLTRHESELLRSQIEAAKQQRQLELEQKQRKGAELASLLMDVSTPAEHWHRYLRLKRISPSELREASGALLNPMVDIEGNLVNVQKIWPDGTKRFLPGARVAGAFSLLGTIDPEGRLYVCEGWATGATIHQHTGDPVACAMNCGNLLPVAAALRSRYSKLEIIIAGDDDRRTVGNPGRTKANEAASKAGAKVVFPEFCRTDCECSDFNDLHCCRLAGGVQ